MRSARKIASQLNESRETIRWVLHNDLGMSTYKRHRIHGLTDAVVAKRLERSKIMLVWHVVDYGQSCSVTFLLKIGCLTSSKRVRSYVLGCDLHKVRVPLVFINRGVKINAKYFKHLLMAARTTIFGSSKTKPHPTQHKSSRSGLKKICQIF
jgi:hypothetical protein